MGVEPTKVLIVDDDRSCAKALGRILRTLGCEVQVAHSGTAALAVASDFRPRLVILDIRMPGMDGLETAKRLRTQTWAKHAVLATHSGTISAGTADRSIAAGCDYHVAKPASAAVLLAILQELDDHD